MNRSISWQKIKLMVALLCSFALAFTMFGCKSKSNSSTSNEGTTKVQLQIFAANSLSKAMDEAQKAYISDGHDNISFADTQYKSSGELNEMLGAGASADILISASKGSMDTAQEKGLIDDTSRFDLFKNDLVMVSSQNSNIENVTLDDIVAGKYSICVGDDSVPAGNYAAQTLSTVGIYKPAQGDEGKSGKNISGKGGSYVGSIKVITDTSVGNVCKHAESGAVDVVFVYTSDVYRFGGAKIVGTIDNSTHKQIVYPASLTKDCKNKEEANEFLKWCAENEKAKQIWTKWGFELA